MTVNPQITDSISQSNVKVLGEAPATAMANLYQSTAHAMGIAFENAVTAQQQSMNTAQAATVQGIATLYSIDTAATGEAAAKSLENSAAAIAIPNVTIPSTPHVAAPGDFAYGVHAVGDSFAASLDALGKATCDNLMRILQIAATSACLTAMIAQPEKAASYEEVLAAIRKLA